MSEIITSKSQIPAFTVFTPTFNRAKTLHRVYESLQQQTFRDFEWLIVDDGSVDDTSSIVEAWQHDAAFPIRYVWQKNGHKKTAFNHGVRLARGELFLVADSDDSFPPDALERFVHYWQAIPENERQRFVGVWGLCQDAQGNVIGDRFPGNWGMDSDLLEMRYRFGMQGKKWGFSRTDVLRAYPFPEHLPGHVPEGVVWTAIATHYKTRFINEVVRIYFQDAVNQLSLTGNPARDAPGTLYWKRSVLGLELPWFWRKPVHFLLEASRWTRFRLHLKNAKALNTHFWPVTFGGGFLVIAMSPLGIAWWIFDKARG
jgi:glycosyltransferase involved in cell wall biosynthesis